MATTEPTRSGATTTDPSTSDTAGHGRLSAFADEIESLTAQTTQSGREQLFQRLGAAAMAIGVVLALACYFVANGQASGDLAVDNAEQNELIVLALAGVALAVVGSIVWLRYSLGRLLRLWLLRQLYENKANLATVAGDGRH